MPRLIERPPRPPQKTRRSRNLMILALTRKPKKIAIVDYARSKMNFGLRTISFAGICRLLKRSATSGPNFRVNRSYGVLSTRTGGQLFLCDVHAFARLCEDRLWRKSERPGYPVGRAAVVERVLEAQAFARRQPGLGFAVLFFGRRQRRLQRLVPFFSFRTACPDALENTIFS